MVPDEWKLLALSEITKEKISYGIVQAGPHLQDGVPYIKSSDVGGKINIFLLQKTSKEIHHKYRQSSVHPGDIVFSLRGNIGERSIVPDSLPEANLTQGTARISVNEFNHRNFIYYQLGSTSVLNRINRLSKGSTFKEISLKELRKVKIPLAPLPEQKKIARILSTWDKAIETVEKLIENSQAQKKALMQQLLTGKRRLPGFDDGWLTYKLSEIFHFKKGKGLSKGEINSDGKYKCILYGELYTKYAEIIHTVASRTNSNNALNSTVGDVLIPCSTTTSGIDLANATCLQESNVLLGGDITVLRPKNQNIDPEFIAYLLTHIKKHEIARLAQGITIIHLYGRDLKNISITLPSIDEQKEIARIIKNSDKEIGIMNEQLNQLQAEKKALMQQLLTGKRRVQIN